MTERPETRYALSGDVHIAYQVTGEGPFDLVFVPGFVTHMEMQWAMPGFGDFLGALGSFARLIRFDKRGTGMSDPVTGAPSLEMRMDDVRAVMNAVGSRCAAIFGLSEGAAMSILFAATYPERVAALVVRSCSPRTMWAPDFPWGRTDAAYQQETNQAMSVYLLRDEARSAVRALGMTGDDEIEAYIDLVRYGASPGMLEALYRMNREIDVRDVLPTVRVPTLVLHGREDQIVPVEVGRYTAGRMRSARFVELGDRRWRELLERHYALVRRELVHHRGREVDTTGDGFLATFDGPARAIRCACAIVDGMHELGLSIRAGLHTGECEIADGKIAGIAVHTGARVAATAGADEVVVSSTVKDLVAGSGIGFEDRGAHQLKGLPTEWRLFTVQRNQ